MLSDRIRYTAQHRSRKGQDRRIHAEPSYSLIYGHCNDMAVCQPAAGVIMLVLAFLMGVVSVLGGVHFVKDVLAGAGIGVLIGIIGLFLI